MKIFAFGSSLVSSYWNGAATYYRGCYKYLARLGYQVTFAEPDAYGRQTHRDDVDLSFANLVTYKPVGSEGDFGHGPDYEHLPTLKQMFEEARKADVVVKHSGIGVDDALTESLILEAQPDALAIYWDVDSPATLARMDADPNDSFRAVVPRLDAVFSYGGGPVCREGFDRYGVRHYIQAYNGLDPETHHPVAPDPRYACDLAFLGNRLPDREARVEELFLRAAALAPDQTFLLGGEGWGDKPMPPNVRYIGHVPTAQHNVLNCSARTVLNINRASMANSGFSPPTRVFEAAGAAACMLCDDWPGLDDCFQPDEEILVVRNAEDVVRHLHTHDAAATKRIGEAFHRRALKDHTYAQRAAQADEAIRYLKSRR
ncbi:CgeB family protein [Terriglobus sp.]|uniref:CgeB family protein n=1 Tax=Terriglobus sp. TaxID=1889013 RepID=UPI003AFFC392